MSQYNASDRLQDALLRIEFDLLRAVRIASEHNMEGQLADLHLIADEIHRLFDAEGRKYRRPSGPAS